MWGLWTLSLILKQPCFFNNCHILVVQRDFIVIFAHMYTVHPDQIHRLPCSSLFPIPPS
jgi:hypothetical protein